MIGHGRQYGTLANFGTEGCVLPVFPATFFFLDFSNDVLGILRFGADLLIQRSPPDQHSSPPPIETQVANNNHATKSQACHKERIN